MERPLLTESITPEDFKAFYWLKEELTVFCRTKGISTNGGKQELEARIIHYLETGKAINKTTQNTTISKFDWNNAPLSSQTIITDNYKNSENVRRFMTGKIGKHFRFNTAFMNWMKQNTGKTLQDAINEWNKIHEKKKDTHSKTEISSQFEYNTYIRDFLADNKGMGLKQAIHFWKLKRNRRGDNKYSKEDLKLT